MLPSAATTSPTSPSAGGGPPSQLPAGADPEEEEQVEYPQRFGHFTAVHWWGLQ